MYGYGLCVCVCVFVCFLDFLLLLKLQNIDTDNLYLFVLFACQLQKIETVTTVQKSTCTWNDNFSLATCPPQNQNY